MDVVVISLEAWDEVWRRNQHFATAALRDDPGMRMLFVEPDHDALHDVSRRIRPTTGARLAHLAPGESPFADRVWRWSATKVTPRRFDPTYDDRWARRVRRAARRLGFDRPVLWVNDPRGAVVAKQSGWPTVYDVTDDWLAAERTPAQHDRLVRQEGYLLLHAAALTACSPALAAAKQGAAPVSLITNGVDVDHWRTPRPRPAELPAPCAVYLGTLHRDRLDVALLLTAARALSGEVTLVLLGPNALDATDTAELQRAGVLLLGSRPYARLPGYLQHADVLVTPHVVTTFTESLDPIKLYEYLAVGRPIVSTPVAGFRDRPEVHLADRESFARAIRTEVSSPPKPAATPAESLPTWADQGARFSRLLRDAAAARDLQE